MDDFSGEAANPYPYDPFPDAAGEAFDFLRSSRREGGVHIPAFARHTLERLRETGLIHRTDIEPPDNIRRIKVDGQQDLWIRFGTRRTTQGYKAIEVMDSPRTDRAILAAMVAWTSDPVDFEQLRPAIAYTWALSTHAEQFESTIDTVMEYLREGEVSLEDFKSVADVLNRFTRNQRLVRNLEFLLPLVRYYKPEIDNYSPEEQWNLVEQACVHVKNVLESLSKLQAFLEYGAPERRLIRTP